MPLEIPHGRAPDELVSTEVVGRVHVSDGQDPHRARIESRPMASSAGGAAPEIDVSVVVASHARESRLATLLDALAQQTVGRGGWEVVVVHAYDRATTERVLEGHELAADG